MEKIIGIVAGVAGIIGTGLAAYSHFTGQEPDEQLTNLIVEERERHSELVKVLEKIASKGFTMSVPDIQVEQPIDASNIGAGQPQDIQKENVCEVEEPSNVIIVSAINVRSGPAKFSSLASWLGALKKGDKIKVIKSKASGVFGLGTKWVNIQYCDKGIKTGWISSKLEGGSPTMAEL